mmetsp:Transcript_438/g.696  ORF Transcript_438/g.696 Transcript_438/m.696 type:complete len:181 (+) Transcript_438:923-1465(+)
MPTTNHPTSHHSSIPINTALQSSVPTQNTTGYANNSNNLGGIPNNYSLFANMSPSIPNNQQPPANQNIQTPIQQHTIPIYNNNSSYPSQTPTPPNLPVPNTSHSYAQSTLLPLPYSKHDLNLIFPKYKDSDPYLVWKSQCIIKAQVFNELPHLVSIINGKCHFNKDMNSIHSNVLKMAAI